MLIAQGHEGYSVAANGLGQNGFGAGYNGAASCWRSALRW